VPGDEAFYTRRVMPDVVRRVQEYQERFGRVLVVGL
jgi:hypothetical protein